MEDTPLRVPAVCPDCGKEFLTEFPSIFIAEALNTGGPIRLYASCHDKTWSASSPEREQLQEYLEAVDLCPTG